MSLITRGQIQTLLRPGLLTVFGDYNIWEPQWKKIYTTHQSDKATEYDMEMQGLGLAQPKGDGEAVASGIMQQGFMTSYVNQYYGLSFQITRASILDNLYEKEFPQQAMQLRNSLETLKNINAMYIFNNAFNASGAVSDKKPLCATDHPTATGTLANTFSNPVQMNETAIEDAITIIKGWTNLGGIKINMNTIKFLVPQARTYDATRIFKSAYTPFSANNAVNPLVTDNWMPGGVLTNQFITNPQSWFIITDEENGFKYMMREKLEIKFITDINTDNVTVRAIERYSMNCSNWRATFGSLGA